MLLLMLRVSFDITLIVYDIAAMIFAITLFLLISLIDTSFFSPHAIISPLFRHIFTLSYHFLLFYFYACHADISPCLTPLLFSAAAALPLILPA